MAAAKDNEKKFIKSFNEKVRNGSLSEQKTLDITDKYGRKLSCSIDYFIEHGNQQILIEIDSYNMAKVVTGQYLLINQFRDKNLTNPIFLIIHTYKNYNPERTIKYLEYVKENALQGKGINFGVIHIEKFENWEGGDIEDFVKLFNA